MPERLSQIIRLINDERFYPWISSRRVLLLGLGGAGTIVAELLVRSGVRFLTLIDGERVANSDLNREFSALPDDIGKLKVDVVRARLIALLACDAPAEPADIRALPVCPDAAFISGLSLFDFDVLVDCTQPLPPKITLLTRAAAHGQRLDMISLLGCDDLLDGLRFHIGRLDEIEPEALKVRLREQLHGHPLGPVRFVYSTAQPVASGAGRSGAHAHGSAGHVGAAAASAVTQAFLDIFFANRHYILAIDSADTASCVAVIACDRDFSLSPTLLCHKKMEIAQAELAPAQLAERHAEQLPRMVSSAASLAPRIDTVAVATRPGTIKCLEAGYRVARKAARKHHARLMLADRQESRLTMCFFGRPARFPCLALLLGDDDAQIVYAQALGRYCLLAGSRDIGPGILFDLLARHAMPEGRAHSAEAVDVLARYAPQPDAHEYRQLEALSASLRFGAGPMEFRPAAQAIAELSGRIRPVVLARFMQEALAEALIGQLESVIAHKLPGATVQQIALGGSVAACSGLRARIRAWCEQHDYPFCAAETADLCADSAVMVAQSAFLQLQDEARRHLIHAPERPCASQGALIEQQATFAVDSRVGGLAPAPAERHSVVLHPDLFLAAARAVLGGERVIFPTETVYGLGVSLHQAEAVQALVAAPDHADGLPPVTHIASLSMLDALIERVNAQQEQLMQAFWPGPLTILFESPRAGLAPAALTAGRFLAVRMPDHPIAIALIAAATTPIVAIDARRAGTPCVTCPTHALQDFDGMVRCILDGGPARYGLESTLVHADARGVAILRHGPISAAQIIQATGLPLAPSKSPAANGGEPSCRTRRPLYLCSGDAAYLDAMTASLCRQGKRVGLLLDETMPAPAQASKVFFYRRIGESLYAGLRGLDQSGIDIILVQEPVGDALQREVVMEKLQQVAIGAFSQN
jgi:L-threonylcarbamoyladenylate synthase